MVDFTTANNALKTVYLGVLSNMLNLKANPLFAKIKQTTKGVSGKEIKVLAPVGVNGGICATSETGELPKTTDAGYVTLTSSLKNLYGRIEISDKAIRASQSSAGAFVNLLNDEMERLVEASAYNLSRMIYGNGSGLLGEIVSLAADKKTITLANVAPFVEGMVIDIYDEDSSDFVSNCKGVKITKVNRADGTITVDRELVEVTSADEGGYYVVLQNSLNNEITGVNALFDLDIKQLYGLKKSDYAFMNGYFKNSFGEFSEIKLITEIDNVEGNSGYEIDYITCSPDVRRQYQKALIDNQKPVMTIDIEGGFKALDFYGKALVSDRFVDSGTAYLLNTSNFALHQLCDWEWMSDESGNILTQKSGYAAYSATLVKYADLICSAPYGQGKITDITV